VTEDQAIASVNDARAAHDIPPDFTVQGAEQRIIEVVEGAAIEGRSDTSGPIRDALVWAVVLTYRQFFIEIAVDDATGKPVRILRSR
jgi:hypothetical protein